LRLEKSRETIEDKAERLRRDLSGIPNAFAIRFDRSAAEGPPDGMDDPEPKIKTVGDSFMEFTTFSKETGKGISF